MDLAGGRTRVDIGGGRFIGLDLKTGQMQICRFRPQINRGASGEVGWQLRRACGVIVKLASRRNEFVKAACLLEALRKNWTVLLLRGIWVVCLMDGVYIERVGWLRELTLSKPLGRLSF